MSGMPGTPRARQGLREGGCAVEVSVSDELCGRIVDFFAVEQGVIGLVGLLAADYSPGTSIVVVAPQPWMNKFGRSKDLLHGSRSCIRACRACGGNPLRRNVRQPSESAPPTTGALRLRPRRAGTDAAGGPVPVGVRLVSGRLVPRLVWHGCCRSGVSEVLARAVTGASGVEQL